LRKTYFHSALFVFLFSLFICVLYNLTVAAHYTSTRDSIQYQMIGIHFIKDQCYCLHLPYSTVNRAPLWPVILGLFSLLFNTNDFPVRMFLCVLDASSCLIIYLFARRLFNERLALVAGIVAALYPGLFLYTGWLYSEMLYTFLLLALSYTLYLFHNQPRTYYIILSAILLGLLALTRPNGLLMLIPLLGWLLVHEGHGWIQWRALLRHTMIVLVIVAVMIAPWTVRNYTVTASFVPIASGDGTVLQGAYNDQVVAQPWYQVTWMNPLLATPDLAKTFPPLACNAACEVNRENIYKQTSINWIKTHISIMPVALAKHFLNMWIPIVSEADLPSTRFPGQLSSQIVLAMMIIMPMPIFLLAIWGGIMLRRSWRQLLFIYLTILITIGENIAFYGAPRFRAPIEPWLILFAVVSGSHIWQKYRRRSPHKQSHEAISVPSTH
jgi:4-amino-4-deoxy-L-arabinose transferase-like glycosyltransferase